MALAYFLTFTTYGTWLHGTEKGLGSVDDDHNTYGTPLVPRDPAREERERAAMTEAPYSLDEPRRIIVRDALITLATEKDWCLHAAHVRTNHIHVVITAERDPDRLLSDLKARASRDLTLAGFESPDRHRWTRHGSTRHLFHEDSVVRAIRYTLDDQGDRMQWYKHPEAP